MQLRTLEIFCDVAGLRSFSKAASARGITQSAVSQAIHQLEHSLGVQLIDRSTRPLTLTEPGTRYHNGLAEILSKYHRLEQDVTSVAKEVHGTLHVAVIYSVGLSYLPDAREEFSRRFPDVDVRVQYGRKEAVLDDIATGKAELGLVSFPKSDKELIAVPWQKEPVRLVCSAKHPLAKRNEARAEDLDGIEMVGFEPNLELGQMIDSQLRSVGVRVDFRNVFDNTDSIVRAIEANDSAGFLPEAAVRRETAIGSLRVVACRQLRMTRPLGIVFRRAERPSRAGYEFGSLLLGRPLEPDREKRSSGSQRKSPLARSQIDAASSVVA